MANAHGYAEWLLSIVRNNPHNKLPVLSLLLLALASCGDKNDGNSGPSFTQNVTWYMGFKEGLNESSSEKQFENALNEVSEKFLAGSVSTNQGFLDGTLYEAKDYEFVTGKVPVYVWDIFLEGLYRVLNPNNLIGSCYLFNYIEIPERGGAGSVYVIHAIVINQDADIKYYASKGTLVPLEYGGKTLNSQKKACYINIMVVALD